MFPRGEELDACENISVCVDGPCSAGLDHGANKMVVCGNVSTVASRLTTGWD